MAWRDPKNCVVCGVEFAPKNSQNLTCSFLCCMKRVKQKQTEAYFRRRTEHYRIPKFCSAKCSRRTYYIKKNFNPKHCKACGAEFTPKSSRHIRCGSVRCEKENNVIMYRKRKSQQAVKLPKLCSICGCDISLLHGRRTVCKSFACVDAKQRRYNKCYYLENREEIQKQRRLFTKQRRCGD